MKKLLNRIKPTFVFISKLSAVLFFGFVALLIIFGASISATVDDLRLTDQVAMLAVMFAVLPTVAQLLSLVDNRKTKITSTGHCPDCNKCYPMTSVIEKE